MTRLGFYSAIVAAVFALVMVTSPASAHTVQIKWSDNGSGSYTFYAGTYHLPGSSSGYGNSGGLIVNGTTYWFTSVVSSPPAAATGGQQSPCYTGLPIVGWQVVTVTGLNFCTPVSITTTRTAAYEAPWSCFPITACFDSQAPVITPSSMVSMWPPNHSYMEFTVEDMVASVTDNCASLSAADVSIHQAWSDEVEDAVGLGDGETLDDIVIACDGQSIELRKERQGAGNGRVYTVHLKVSDGCGNVADAYFQAEVRHSGKGLAAIDDGVGAGYAEFNCVAKKDRNVAGLPQSIMLEQNYPNPFNPSTTISYTLPEAGQVRLTVYNAVGQMVAQPVNDMRDAGAHTLTWNAVSSQGVSLPSGLYMYRLEYAGQSVQRTMMLMK